MRAGVSRRSTPTRQRVGVLVLWGRRPVAEIEIGRGKVARRADGFDEVAIVPSRRTRGPDDVDVSWEVRGYSVALPMMASAMDAGVSPSTAVEIGRLGGLA